MSTQIKIVSVSLLVIFALTARGGESPTRAAGAESAAKSNIEVRVGLTMRSGDAKPVGNGKVYLSTKKTSEIFRGLVAYTDGQKSTIGKATDSEEEKLQMFLYCWVNSSGKYDFFAEHRARAHELMEKASIEVSITDFNGTATFEDVPRGDYFLICATSLGGGAVMEKSISVKSSKAKVILSNEDVVK